MFVLSSTQGRNNKGTIFLFAAGNGGNNGDSCAADGYVQSIYTIAIGALYSDGTPTNYDERCSAKMASTFVNDANNTRIVRTIHKSIKNSNNLLTRNSLYFKVMEVNVF